MRQSNEYQLDKGLPKLCYVVDNGNQLADYNLPYKRELIFFPELSFYCAYIFLIFLINDR